MNRLSRKVLLASFSALLLLVGSCGLVVVELRRMEAATVTIMRDYGRALLEGEFHEALTRAVGEAASYVQSGNDDYRREANEALERAHRAATMLRKIAEEVPTSQPDDLFHALYLERQEILLRETVGRISAATAAMTEGRHVATAESLQRIYAGEEAADMLWRGLAG